MQTDNDALLDYMEEAEDYKNNTEKSLTELNERLNQMTREKEDKSIMLEQEKIKTQGYLKDIERIEYNKKKQQMENDKLITNLNQSISITKEELNTQSERYRILETELYKKTDENNEFKNQIKELQIILAETKGNADKDIEELSNN